MKGESTEGGWINRRRDEDAEARSLFSRCNEYTLTAHRRCEDHPASERTGLSSEDGQTDGRDREGMKEGKKTRRMGWRTTTRHTCMSRRFCPAVLDLHGTQRQRNRLRGGDGVFIYAIAALRKSVRERETLNVVVWGCAKGTWITWPAVPFILHARLQEPHNCRKLFIRRTVYQLIIC